MTWIALLWRWFCNGLAKIRSLARAEERPSQRWVLCVWKQCVVALGSTCAVHFLHVAAFECVVARVFARLRLVFLSANEDERCALRLHVNAISWP